MNWRVIRVSLGGSKRYAREYFCGSTANMAVGLKLRAYCREWRRRTDETDVSNSRSVCARSIQTAL